MPTTHTPGPWSIDSNTVDLITADCDGEAVCEIARRENSGGDDDTLSGEERANAHLIAAAPEMLKCLKWALTGLQYLAPDRFDEEEHEAEWNRRLAEMDATITKAEGGA